MATSSDKSDIEIDFMVSKYPDLSHLLAAGSKSVLTYVHKDAFLKKIVHKQMKKLTPFQFPCIIFVSLKTLERILNQLQSHTVS